MSREPSRSTSEPLRSLLFKRRAPGRLAWIGVRSERGANIAECSVVELLAGKGVAGDYTSRGPGGGKRQVTLLQVEHLPVIAQLTGRADIAPELLRRNLLVEGINLLALRSTTFRIGGAVLQGTGTCDPCSKMERALGTGGYNALRGHGGITARVLTGAVVRVGDEVDFCTSEGGEY